MGELISIITPTKDRWELLRQAMASVRAQTYAAWELIVVDDGSVDATAAEVSRIAREDGRVRLVVREGRPAGANRCRNIGVAAARGEWVTFLDSDDALAPESLRVRAAAMREHAELDFAVFAQEHFRDVPGDLRGAAACRASDADDLDRYLMVDIPWQTAGPIWRRGALERVGAWDEALPCWQDWDFHVRALAMGLKYGRVEGVRDFHRVTLNGRESVSARALTREHLVARERAVGRAYELLCERGLLSMRRRVLLARLHLVFAEQWMQLGERGEARRVWETCLERYLIDASRHRQGAMLLRLWPLRPARAAFRRYLHLCWPAELRMNLAAAGAAGAAGARHA